MRAPFAGPVPRPQTRIRRLAAASLAALALSACAAGPTGAPVGPSSAALPALFVSPFGELFVGAAGEPWPVADWFMGADADLDAALSFEEFAADGRRWFDRLDAEKDGRLTTSELAAYETSLRGFGGPPAPRPAPQQRARPPRATIGAYGAVAEAGFFNLPQPVKAADVNVDQRISAEEWRAATERWFVALDTDRDGKLSLATLPKTPLQRRAEAG